MIFETLARNTAISHLKYPQLSFSFQLFRVFHPSSIVQITSVSCKSNPICPPSAPPVRPLGARPPGSDLYLPRPTDSQLAYVKTPTPLQEAKEAITSERGLIPTSEKTTILSNQQNPPSPAKSGPRHKSRLISLVERKKSCCHSSCCRMLMSLQPAIQPCQLTTIAASKGNP